MWGLWGADFWAQPHEVFFGWLIKNDYALLCSGGCRLEAGDTAGLETCAT
jgi:hypothetical protein